MNLVEWLQGLMTSFGAQWVMWLMIVLSVISVAVMLERGWFYFSLRDDIPKLAADLRNQLRDADVDGALHRFVGGFHAAIGLEQAGDDHGGLRAR